jgi:hypothetical protein
MKIQRYPIENESPARLELRWSGLEAQVYFDGEHAATLDGAAGLKQGWSKDLEDGRKVEIRTVRRGGLPELSVLLNGEHVPSSPSHPDKILRTSSNALLALSAFMIGTGALGIWGRTWIEALFGIFYLIGAIFLRNRRRLGAAIIAIPLFVNLDILLFSAFSRQIDRRWFFDLALRIIFATFVVRSYQAARDSQLLNRAA